MCVFGLFNSSIVLLRFALFFCFYAVRVSYYMLLSTGFFSRFRESRMAEFDPFERNSQTCSVNV